MFVLLPTPSVLQSASITCFATEESLRDIRALEAAARQCEGLKAFRNWIEAPDVALVRSALKTSTAAVDNDPPELKEFKATHRAAKRNWQLPSDFPNPAVIEAYAAPKYGWWRF